METIGRSVRASIDFNGPLNALSVSPNNKLIAVGGRDVLKVVSLETTGFSEKRNLRAGKQNLNFSTNDIRWHPQSDSIFATAATNGAVVIWNLQREGFMHAQEHVLKGHRRAVNRICWHTTDINLLISGSQDGTIKLWDKRGKGASTYQPKSESCRDVRFSPYQSNKFAAAFENGIVQTWDIRKNNQPQMKFTAHKGLVLALDWHPIKPNIIASGGRDRYVKVWDLADVKQPKYTIQTIASVGRVQWRPNCIDHIATSSSLMDNSIHVWDTPRPCIPIASMKGHSDIASGIQWLDTPMSPTFGISENVSEWGGHDYWQHMLASSKDGTLRLHSLADSFKPHESLPTIALALNSRGHVAFSHDYIDRSCSSLKINRHFNISSALFTVTDPTSSSRHQHQLAVGNLVNQHSVVLHKEADDHDSSHSRHSTFVPLKHASMHSSNSSNSLSNMLGGSSMSAQHHQLARTSNQFSTGSSLSGSSNSFMGSTLQQGTNPQGENPIPSALIALVSMRGVNSEDSLQKIFDGNEKEILAASIRIQKMQEEFAEGLHLVDAFGFDEQVFRFLAKCYVLYDESKSFDEVCFHNALAAFVTGDSILFQMWRMLALLYEDEDDVEPEIEEQFMEQTEINVQLKQHIGGRKNARSMGLVGAGGINGKASNNHHHTTVDGSRNETTMLLKKLDDVNPHAMQGFDPYPYDLKSRVMASPNLSDKSSNKNTTDMSRKTLVMNTIKPSTSSSNSTGGSSKSIMVHGNVVRGEVSRLRDSLLKELLEYYAEKADIQTCVTIVTVVSKKSDVEKIMGKSWLQQIHMHYIDMLHQMRIYSTANEIVSNCSDSSIRQMNMKSTSVYSNCGKCSKPLENYGNDTSSLAGSICSNCSNLTARCSICQLPVRGLYVWCPVCSHGGHLEHLKEWFATEKVCPTGCSHQCSLEFQMTK